MIIENDRIYRHSTLRINYTTYDGRREQDIVNPRTRADVMILSAEDKDSNDFHPYWYARVIDIFHARVRHIGPASRSTDPKRMEFLFIRWFGRDLKERGGWKRQQLHRVRFVHEDDPSPFGFLDPLEVVRAVHLIPAFAFQTTTLLMQPSHYARRFQSDDEDWLYFYIGMYVNDHTVLPWP